MQPVICRSCDHDIIDLDNNFGYLFQTLLFLVYDIDWGPPNNIDRDQQQKNRLSNSILISNDLLAELTNKRYY